jgi:hypothetical protein
MLWTAATGGAPWKAPKPSIWPKEGQQMDAAEKSSKWSINQQRLKFAKSTARQPIDVGDELNLVLHDRRRCP